MTARRCAFHFEATGKRCGAYAGHDLEYCTRHQRVVDGPRTVAEPELTETDELEDPVELLEEEEEQSQTVAPAYVRRTVPVPDVPPPAEDPHTRSARYARLLLLQEQRAREGQPAAIAADGTTRMPFKVIPRRQRPDATLMLDPTTGKPPASVPPGWVVRWVSTTDWMGRPSEARIGNQEDYGGQVVRDANGRPIEGRFGLGMMLPESQEALRIAEQAPMGSLSQDAELTAMDDMAEQVNRQAGSRVARVTAMPEHGARRKWTGDRPDPDD